jgi:copper resistance protein D
MIDVLWLLLRAAGLILTLQGAGAALFGALFGSPLNPSSRGTIARLGRHLTLVALGLLLVQMAFEPAHLAGDWTGLVQRPLWHMLPQDSALHALLLRAGALLVIALGTPRAPRTSAAMGGLLLAASFLLTGHTDTPAHAGALGLVLAVHVVAVLYWFGSLLPLMQVLKREAAAIAAQAVTAFSRLAVFAVPLLGLAGGVLAVVLLPDVAALASRYGQLLLLKVTLFLVTFALAGWNRLRLAPALARGEAGAATTLRRSILAEYLLLLAVLAVTAVMSGAFSPAGD